MRIVVCVEQVYDPASVKLSRSREELDLREAVPVTNPADRYALEAGLRLAESQGGEVIALTVGPEDAEDTVHEAVAMGADHGVLVVAPAAAGAGLVAALKAALDKLGSVDLVLTGQVGGLDGSGALPARLAAALGWPVLLDVSCFQAAGEGLEAVVAEAGAAWALPVNGPTVAAVIPGPDRPRYPHASRIANAWQPGMVEVWQTVDLQTDPDSLNPDVEWGGLVLGPERTRGEVLTGSVDETVTALIENLRTRRLLATGG